MWKLVLFLPLLLLGCVTETVSAPTNKIKVSIVPSIHGLHLDPYYKYSLADLENTIKKTNPQMLCVEISADAYNSTLEGLFPPEAAYVAEDFTGRGVTVVPSDWRADRGSYTKAPESIEAQAQGLRLVFKEKMDQQPNPVAWLISVEGKALTRAIHDLYIQQAGESSDGFWKTRNAKIVENCLRKARSAGRSRVTLVYGIDHFYALEEALIPIPDVEPVDTVLVQSSDKVLPAGVSNNVLLRWQRNYKNLQAAYVANNQSEATKSWIKDSGRMTEIAQFFRAYSRPKH